MTINERIYQVSESYEGIGEIKGMVDNPIVVRAILSVMPWVSNEFDIDGRYAWCGCYAAMIMKEAGFEEHIPKSPFRALSYLDVGRSIKFKEATKGDFLVFSRGTPGSGKGHITQLATEGFNNHQTALCLGGNQNNRVQKSYYQLARLKDIRRIDEISIKSFIDHGFLDRLLIKSL